MSSVRLFLVLSDFRSLCFRSDADVLWSERVFLRFTAVPGTGMVLVPVSADLVLLNLVAVSVSGFLLNLVDLRSRSKFSSESGSLLNLDPASVLKFSTCQVLV